MKLSEPKNLTFIIALVIALIALLSKFIAIPFVSDYAFFILLIGFVLLALANLLKGL